ncbi:hypothetical protein C1H46_035873 [Malus baccata]|uniref:Uncharacterized protein n=1 Tax=Malus baccata TaxID=106549 RepID=A0A540KWL4_MALBA|nr:hypothetical protein C1H46_035873 [Malus baccata]
MGRERDTERQAWVCVVFRVNALCKEAVRRGWLRDQCQGVGFQLSQIGVACSFVVVRSLNLLSPFGTTSYTAVHTVTSWNSGVVAYSHQGDSASITSRSVSCLFIGSVSPKIQIHVPDLSPCKSKNVVVGDGFDGRFPGHGRLVQKVGVEDFAVHRMLRRKGVEGSSRRSGCRGKSCRFGISDGFMEVEEGSVHLAAREGIEGAEIMELREASRKHGRWVESRGDVKAAFKILAKLNKWREKLEVVRISMSEFVQQLEAGASVRIGTEK